MKRACIRAKISSGHQREWGAAFAAGLRKHGWQTEVSEQTRECDLLVLWGVRNQLLIAEQKARGGEVCILERGYIGDRFKWTSVSFGGGLNGRAEFRGVPDENRFDRNFAYLVKPWRKQDGYALLIGQVQGDMSLAGVGGNLSRWYFETATALSKKGYKVRFRPHPVQVRRGVPVGIPAGAKIIDGTLDDAFSDASIVVTFNSNTAVESVLAGVPTIATDIGSIAWDVTTHDVNAEPETPSRLEWARALAWKQWTLDEISSGLCWEHVGEKQCALAD